MNANEGACGFAATQGTVEEPRGGHTSHFSEHPSTCAETTPRGILFNARCSGRALPNNVHSVLCLLKSEQQN